MDLLDQVKKELFEAGIISQSDYEAADREAAEINDGDSIYQSLWIAHGLK